ncbi:hypothetical protein T281_17570 [Rhodomicrobium udaipurense JA643]|uniref:Uncharacterized protein n=1 Tax=Rhodomicrobium udaipurense TaxID=1202716 RepID=A0A8I1G9Y2_9HYPH|nr:hypothetical protein [Rhodomicrobium udaipurense]KAI93291.1 hypothetical protein T281_17570 [Rhodomicrobium udaipurense JA643]MBJ7543242.1 hypothetical protein [Rhodomicrobium udaipurense]
MGAQDGEIPLRDAIALMIARRVDLSKMKNVIEAAVAAQGAVAILLALLTDEQRNDVIPILNEGLERQIEARAREINSGEFDRYMRRWEQ